MLGRIPSNLTKYPFQTVSYAWDRKPEEAENSGASTDFALDKVDLQRLLECLGNTQVLVARVEDAGTA
jgi:hypothetical protein